MSNCVFDFHKLIFDGLQLVKFGKISRELRKKRSFLKFFFKNAVGLNPYKSRLPAFLTAKLRKFSKNFL